MLKTTIEHFKQKGKFFCYTTYWQILKTFVYHCTKFFWNSKKIMTQYERKRWPSNDGHEDGNRIQQNFDGVSLMHDLALYEKQRHGILIKLKKVFDSHLLIGEEFKIKSSRIKTCLCGEIKDVFVTSFRMIDDLERDSPRLEFDMSCIVFLGYGFPIHIKLEYKNYLEQRENITERIYLNNKELFCNELNKVEQFKTSTMSFLTRHLLHNKPDDLKVHDRLDKQLVFNTILYNLFSGFLPEDVMIKFKELSMISSQPEFCVYWNFELQNVEEYKQKHYNDNPEYETHPNNKTHAQHPRQPLKRPRNNNIPYTCTFL
ncbi:hypothetical protein FDP41_012569 [Naegleria fowleri]|uniref:Uncharacterized protein n=1 Tax=Naegleria fowleri TaxID=5763 RepID=A0A6A5C7R3_NAEFO|nr:uncharacterized protein FDP41_012569 [Naegleria fowleri]KAF0981309.1 hypothetical protein FDP41_012569 [Naegleria fowleri]